MSIVKRKSVKTRTTPTDTGGKHGEVVHIMQITDATTPPKAGKKVQLSGTKGC